MRRVKSDSLIRGGIALFILLTGVAMIPLINLPAERIGWDLFAGVYTPELTVNASSGAPGSVFAFTGSNYPPHSTAHLYVNGELFGEVPIDGNGVGTFLLDTTWAAAGAYNVTLEVDINASATELIQLVVGGPLVSPPAGFPGLEFELVNPVFLPAVLT